MLHTHLLPQESEQFLAVVAYQSPLFEVIGKPTKSVTNLPRGEISSELSSSRMFRATTPEAKGRSTALPIDLLHFCSFYLLLAPGLNTFFVCVMLQVASLPISPGFTPSPIIVSSRIESHAVSWLLPAEPLR